MTYNSETVISKCVQSIQLSLYPREKVSIIVVDNNSSDKTLEILKVLQSSLDNLVLVESPSNVGFGVAINIGFKKATGNYVLILNPDTELEPHTILDLVRAALSPESRRVAAWEARQQPFEHPKAYDPVTLETEWFSGACVLVLNEVFRVAGGFDENIFLYGEDVELSWRLRALGYKLRYVPNAVVQHNTYGDPTKIKVTQFYNTIVSNGILRCKYGNLWNLIEYGCRILAVLINPPKLVTVRRNLISHLWSSMPKFSNAVSWRFSTRHSVPKSISRFSGWNYEMRRRGEFHPCLNRKRSSSVTVVVRTIQRPYYLREALQSIRHQTYQPQQVVVIEDGAPVSAQVVAEYPDLKIDYRATLNKVGRCRVGNIGLALATGQFINFLDDDDLFFADHVETLVDSLETNASYEAAYSIGFEVKTNIISVQPFVYEEKAYKIVHDQPFERSIFNKRNIIPINTMMFSRDLFLKHGGFDEKLEVLEDWDLWRRYSRYTDFLFVDKLTCLYRVPFDRRAMLLRQQKLDEEREKMGALLHVGREVAD